MRFVPPWKSLHVEIGHVHGVNVYIIELKSTKHDKTTSTTDPDFENIYRIFRKRGGQLECQTILDNNLRIPVKFFSEGFDKAAGSMKMNFSNIENEIKRIRGKI